MSEWVLLLGGSTGHGAATAKKLANDGYGIIAFHFDRGEAKKIAEETISEVNELTSGRCHYFNTNAAAEETIDKHLPEIQKITNGKPLKLLLHSIAFGTTTVFDQCQVQLLFLLYHISRLHQRYVECDPTLA